jgi:hypothetical protein
MMPLGYGGWNWIPTPRLLQTDESSLVRAASVPHRRWQVTEVRRWTQLMDLTWVFRPRAGTSDRGHTKRTTTHSALQTRDWVSACQRNTVRNPITELYVCPSVRPMIQLQTVIKQPSYSSPSEHQILKLYTKTTPLGATRCVISTCSLQQSRHDRNANFWGTNNTSVVNFEMMYGERIC